MVKLGKNLIQSFSLCSIIQVLLHCHECHPCSHNYFFLSLIRRYFAFDQQNSKWFPIKRQPVSVPFRGWLNFHSNKLILLSPVLIYTSFIDWLSFDLRHISTLILMTVWPMTNLPLCYKFNIFPHSDSAAANYPLCEWNLVQFFCVTINKMVCDGHLCCV